MGFEIWPLRMDWDVQKSGSGIYDALKEKLETLDNSAEEFDNNYER